MAKTTIQVDTETRDQLAQLAAEAGTTMGALLASWAAEHHTRNQRAERVEQGRAAMRRHMPNPPSDEILDAAPDDIIDRVHKIADEIRARAATGGQAA
ncbi:hypothetical protein [Streptacidiphilus rugosus]|uniref:hypothetical protein n=1 Tax=Streptacidiphilus rugosus TaxID=405783 RepID=UPI0005699E1E|nr:hypothetical protein [Streptacidiphilus rugosus]